MNNEQQSKNDYFSEVENAKSFVLSRENWRNSLSGDEGLYRDGVNFLEKLDKHRYVYQWNWLGIPVIKLPDDIMVLQEYFFEEKPTAIIEVGIARGGGIALSASLQKLNHTAVKILGIDLKIFSHTLHAIESLEINGIELLECDSTSYLARERSIEFLGGHNKALVVLDSDHSHSHVLRELELYSELLPVGSHILVADTIIEDYLTNLTIRNWGKGNSPASALREFLNSNKNWVIDAKYSRRAAISESRDGWITKISL